MEQTDITNEALKSSSNFGNIINELTIKCALTIVILKIAIDI